MQTFSHRVRLITTTLLLITAPLVPAWAWVCSKKGPNIIYNINDIYINGCGPIRCPATKTVEGTTGYFVHGYLEPYFRPSATGSGSPQACNPTTCNLWCAYSYWSNSQGRYVTGFGDYYFFPTGTMNFWTPGASACSPAVSPACGP